ncbi:MAG: serine hydrolase domain-containing protein [Pirellulales bacterium]
MAHELHRGNANRRNQRCERRRGWRWSVRLQAEPLEVRQLMAVDLSASTFSPALMAAAIAELSAGNAVGYGYSINYHGDANARTGGDGLARTAADIPARIFNSLVEMEVSSVSKPITATGVLHFLQSMPGGLDAALKTRLIDYLPSDWNPGPNTQFITLRHLLTHTSGLSETNNAIGVNFENYGNNTYANLQNLIQTGLSAPNVAADDIFDGPRWNLGDNYSNANFTLLARVVLPKLLNPALNLTAASFPGLRDSISGTVYANYINTEIFEPLGITGADLVGNDANPAKGYNLGVNAPGLSMSNHSSLGGAFGWKLSARELGLFLDGIQRDNSILFNSTRVMRDAQELGWFNTSDAFGNYYSHNGATSGNSGKFRSLVAAYPGGIEAAYLMNSDDDSLPGGSIGSMLKTAYVNGWSELTVDGTLNSDNFQVQATSVNSRPVITVTLNGVVQFTRWLDGLEKITLNGGLGNDTFNILSWDSSVQLVVNGQGNDDFLTVTQGPGNLEKVNGATFNGGSGSNRLYLYDQNNPNSMPGLSHIYGVTDGAVSRYRGVNVPNVGLVPFPVTFNFSNVDNLRLVTGDLADVVNVVSKPDGLTEIWTGDGDDTLLALETTANLEKADGLSFNGQGGTDSIRLFDQNRSVGDDFLAQYDVQSDSVTRYITGGLIINPNPPQYTVNFPQVENLELTTTEGKDRIRVHAVPVGATVIRGQGSADVLTTTPNEKNMELVRDLTFEGGAGVDAIVIRDENNPYSHATLSNDYSVSASRVARSMQVRALTLPVAVDFSSVEDLTLFTGGQGDEVSVLSTTSGETTIDTGPGNDLVLASSSTQKLESVKDLTVNGGTGTDQLNLLDANNPYDLGPGGGVYTITSSLVKRFAEHLLLPNVAVPVEIGFQAMELVELQGGPQADVFNVSGTAATGALTLVGNLGGDQFHIVSPAYATIAVRGELPTLAPGDQLIVNANGTYPTALIPGLYPPGAGATTLGPAAVQYTGIETTQILPQTPSVPGDLDGDGDVDSADILEFLENWTGALEPGIGDHDASTGDLDGDGDVDSNDILELLENWTGSQSASPDLVFNDADWFAL